MKRLRWGFALLGVLLVLGSISYAGDKCTARYGDGPNKFSLATGSPGELGLLKVLADAFNERIPQACAG